MATALAVIAAGCAKEQVSPGIEDGQEVTVTYNIAAPQGIATKAVSDGLSAKNLSVAVYEDNAGNPGNYLSALDKTATFKDLKATVEFHLVKGKTYHFIFWAQSETGAYTLDKENKVVKISYDGVANDESRDAFFATRKLTVTGALSETVELYRPFAQVNFGTADFEAAKAAGVEPTKSELTATEAATELDLFGREGKVANGASSDITYTEAALPEEKLTVNGVEYTYLSMNYFIPVGKLDEQHVSNLNATFKGEANVEISVPSAPVRANYRTNIFGNLLTDQVIFNIEIKPAYKGEENIDLENITSAVALNALFLNGGSAKLVEDIVLDKTVAVPTGKEVVLDLNGHNISNSEDIWDKQPYDWSLLSVRGGKLTVKGDGKLRSKENDCYAIDVQDGGEVIVEGGEYVGNMHAVYVHTGKATINGGKYSIQQTYSTAGEEYEFVLNCYDKSRKIGKASISVTGGEFVKFNPQNCKAEGEGTNFCADGYKSTKVGDNYIVTAADVTPVASDQGLRTAFNEAASADKAVKIVLSDGTFNWPDGKSDSGVSFPKTINIVGSSKENCVVKFNAGSYPEGCDVSFENVTIENAVGCTYDEYSLAQMVRVKDVTVNNCIIKNQFRILSQGSVNIKNCQFINTNASGFDGYCLNYYGYSDSIVNVENCTFNGVEKAIVLYNEGVKEGKPNSFNLNVKDCKFTASNADTDKAAIQMHTEYGIYGNVSITNCTATGFKTNELSPEGLWWEGNNQTHVATKKFTITVDGVTVQTAE